MLRHRLTDEQWVLIADVFPAPRRTGRPPRDRRTAADDGRIRREGDGTKREPYRFSMLAS